MVRNIGMLVLACCLTLVAGGAFAGDLSQPAVPVSVGADLAAADAGQTEAKKRMKPRPYAEELQKKLKKPGPAAPEPKYKPWDKIVTKEHEKSEGLLTFYTKQEEVLLVIPKDMLDKPLLAILSLSQGIGANFVPKILNRSVYHEVIQVTADDAKATTRRLAKEEGLLVGISSGAACFAALQVAAKLGKGRRLVTILPDGGERYLSMGVFGEQKQ